MKIHQPEPSQADHDRVRDRIYQEWMRRGTPLAPRLLDSKAELRVAGPFGFYLPAVPLKEWGPVEPSFESVTVRIPGGDDRQPRGRRFLVIDLVSPAIVAIADFPDSDGLVGSLDGLRLGTGAVASALNESVRRLHDKLSALGSDGEAKLEFVLDVERGVTVVLARADGAVYATALPPAWCALPATPAGNGPGAAQPGAPLDGGVVVLTGRNDVVELWRKVPPRYEFEGADDKRVRGRGAARDAAYVTLLDRIGAPDNVLRRLDRDGSTRRRLDRFCCDYVLNIQWYDEHLKQQQRWRKIWIAIFLVVGTLAVVAASWMAWHELDGSKSPGPAATVGAQITVLIGGLVGVFKTLASLSDTKTRIALFWKARSNLKERLYRFEHRWRDRVVVDGDIAPGFLADLERELDCAARISAEEQLGFFATYKSPTEVLDSLMTTAEEVVWRATAMGRRSDTEATKRSAEHIAIIQANVDACAARLAELKKSSASSEEIDRAESALKIALATLSQAIAAQAPR